MTIKAKIDTIKYIKEHMENKFFNEYSNVPKEIYRNMEKLERKGFLDTKMKNDEYALYHRPVWFITKKGMRYYNTFMRLRTWLPITAIIMFLAFAFYVARGLAI
jgi:DNA-binding PadR family transcriptional regulator